jgi:hypothetical protein
VGGCLSCFRGMCECTRVGGGDDAAVRPQPCARCPLPAARHSQAVRKPAMLTGATSLWWMVPSSFHLLPGWDCVGHDRTSALASGVQFSLTRWPPMDSTACGDAGARALASSAVLGRSRWPQPEGVRVAARWRHPDGADLMRSYAPVSIDGWPWARASGPRRSYTRSSAALRAPAAPESNARAAWAALRAPSGASGRGGACARSPGRIAHPPRGRRGRRASPPAVHPAATASAPA